MFRERLLRELHELGLGEDLLPGQRWVRAGSALSFSGTPSACGRPGHACGLEKHHYPTSSRILLCDLHARLEEAEPATEYDHREWQGRRAADP